MQRLHHVASPALHRAPLSPHPRQRVLCFVFLTIMGVRWHLRVTFTHIFLVISDVGNLFMCLVTTCVSSLEKCLFNIWPLFWSCCLVLLLLLHYGSSLCFDNNLIQIHDLQTFSPILEVAFSLCWLCFLMHSKREWQTHSSFLARRIPWTGYSSWGHKQSDVTEVTEHTHLILRVF